MRTIMIDGRKMTSRENAHTIFAQKLSFPSYYGRNLDALRDCLGDICVKTRLCIHNCAAAETALGEYVSAIRKTLMLAAEENDYLTVFFDDCAEPFEEEMTGGEATSGNNLASP